MRIVSAKTLMMMPEHTLFCEDVTGNLEFGRIEIKGETIVINGRNAGYYSASMDDFDPGDDDLFERLRNMASDESQTVILDPAMSKSLPVNDGKRFLVYDVQDLKTIRRAVDAAIDVQESTGMSFG